MVFYVRDSRDVTLDLSRKNRRKLPDIKPDQVEIVPMGSPWFKPPLSLHLNLLCPGKSPNTTADRRLESRGASRVGSGTDFVYRPTPSDHGGFVKCVALQASKSVI